jgi:hypothetical protein
MTSAIPCPLPALAREPGLQRALDVNALRDLVQTHVAGGAAIRELRPDYVRWKDRDGSLVGFRATVGCDGDEHHTYLTVRTAEPHRLAEEAARLQHRADEIHGGLRAVTFLPDEALLLLAFPHDRGMPELRRLVQPTKVRSLVQASYPELIPPEMRISKTRSRWQLVRYKPERRAVLCWTLRLTSADRTRRLERILWVRCYAEPTARRSRVATTAARAAGISCPQTLAVPHDRLLLESHVTGQGCDLDAPANAAAAAATLARLHQAAAPAELPAHGMLDELDLVLRAVEDVARLRADFGREAAAIADMLTHTVPSPGPVVFSHGDFHPGQVLIQDGEAGLCDFDRACLAPAAHDLAILHAHCAVMDSRNAAAHALAFQNHYGRTRPLPPASEIAWWTACAMLRSSMAGFRALRPDWPETAAHLLRQAREAAQDASLAFVR